MWFFSSGRLNCQEFYFQMALRSSFACPTAIRSGNGIEQDAGVNFLRAGRRRQMARAAGALHMSFGLLDLVVEAVRQLPR
jgi:hypothetical protein